MLVIAKKLVICSGKPEVLLGYSLHRKSSGFDRLIPSLTCHPPRVIGVAWHGLLLLLALFSFFSRSLVFNIVE